MEGQYLMGSNKVQMKRTSLPKCVNHVHWLFTVDLGRYSSHDVMDLAQHLENLYVSAPM